MSACSQSLTLNTPLRFHQVAPNRYAVTGTPADCVILATIKILQEKPALVISGDHEFIPAATAEHIAQALPNARLVTLKDCGHFTYMECPAPVRENIDSFFSKK